MKFLLELLGAVVVGAVFAVVARLMNIEMTSTQFGVLAGSTAFTTYIMMEVVSAIMKKREAKKNG